MTYGALNTVIMADVEHAREAISDVNHLLINVFSKYLPLYAVHFRCCSTHLLKIALYQSWLYCEMVFAVAERNSG